MFGAVSGYDVVVHTELIAVSPDVRVRITTAWGRHGRARVCVCRYDLAVSEQTAAAIKRTGRPGARGGHGFPILFM